MKIAITSQNRKTITEHAGKCRKFWIYEVEQGIVATKNLIELPIEQSLHASNHEVTPALVGINVLISGGMGAGLFRRLMQQGIQPVITPEENLDQALSDFLANKLERLFPDVAHACHDHTH